MCDCFGSLHTGQLETGTGVAFQFARRERVLERDIFRFGTATSVPLLVGVGRRPGQIDQCCPPWVKHFVMVVRIVAQVSTAFGAQSRAVFLTHRLERL